MSDAFLFLQARKKSIELSYIVSSPKTRGLFES